MTATVPETRVDLSQDEALISLGVRAVTWQHAVRLHNWIAGRPAVLVPCTVPRASVGAGLSADFPFWVKPRYQDVRLLYSLLLTTESECQATIKINGVGVGTGFRIREQRNAAWFSFVRELALQSTTEQELVFTVEATGGTVFVDGLMIEALPRTSLAIDANDLGSDRVLLGIRQPISERTMSANLLDLQSALRDSARRTGFHISWGSLTPYSTVSASYVGMLEGSIMNLGRFLYASDTTRSMIWAAKCYASDASTSAEIRMVNDAGITYITMPAGTTTATWFTKAMTVDAEDNTFSTGLRGGVHDDHMSGVIRTAGSGTVYVETISTLEI